MSRLSNVVGGGINFVVVGLILYLLAILPSWPINLYQFTQCDFKTDNLKCEVVHGLGIIPILSPITVWVDGDSNE